MTTARSTPARTSRERTTTSRPGTERPAAIRRAMRALVAEHGFHGASMGAVAKAAGVAAGTAYVHYASKDELVLAAYLEVKRELGQAAAARVDPDATPEVRFRQLWFGIHAHLDAEPDRARFLVQVDTSPYADRAHALGMAVADDPIIDAAAAPDLVALLAPLPLEVLYDLGRAPAVRLVASGFPITDDQLDGIAAACWRAVTRHDEARPQDRPS